MFKKITIVLAVIILLIILAGMYKFNYLSGNPGYNVDGNKITKEVKTFTECKEAGYMIMESNPEQCFDGKNTFTKKEEKKETKKEADSTVEKKDDKEKKGEGNIEEEMVIKIPRADFGKEGNIVINFDDYLVEKSPAVLAETLTKLFEIRSATNNNEDGVWNGLKFGTVSIKDLVATIDLKGFWFSVGDMSGFYFKQEIESAATQFDTVREVRVRVNDKIFDWCIDSDADPEEDGCDKTPKLWDTTTYKDI